MRDGRNRDWRPWLLLLAAVVIVLDRWTKILISKKIPHGHLVTVIPGFFQLSHVYNTGAAFSLFADSMSPETVRGVLIGFSVLAALVVLGMIWRTGRAFSWSGVALGLILGGAIGNLWDRVKLKYVIDFLDLQVKNYHWPSFNLADSAIVVGACLLLLEIFRTQPGAGGNDR